MEQGHGQWLVRDRQPERLLTQQETNRKLKIPVRNFPKRIFDLHRKTIVSMIGCEKSLLFRQDSTGLHVEAPGRKPCESAYVLKIETI